MRRFLIPAASVLLTLGCGSGASQPGGNSGAGTASPKTDVTKPLTYPLKALAGAKTNIANAHVTQLLSHYYAENGRYPRDFAEFKREILEPARVELPKLSEGQQYDYDAQKHELIVVKSAAP